MDLDDIGPRAWALALRGDFRLPLPPGDRDEARAWRVALGAARASAGLEGSLPATDMLATFVGASAAARGAVLRGVGVAARAGFARTDGADLTRLAAAARQLAREPEDLDLDAEARLAAALTRAWDAHRRGDETPALPELEAEAARAGLPATVIETASLRALVALERGDPEDARRIARRASRMARTESLPQSEYLAHLVLAQVRAHEGHAHLATRILAALARVAPPPWADRLALELVLVAELDAAEAALARGPGEAPRSPAAMAARAILDALEAARADRADDARLHLRSAQDACAGFVPVARRVGELAIAIDPQNDHEEQHGDLAAWRSGCGALPSRLVGISFLGRIAREPGVPLVLVGRGRAPRRMLEVGACFAPGALRLATSAQLRTDAATAVLALAGPGGLARDALFERVYGFAFRPATHQGVLDVLLHRVRDRLAPIGEVTRSDARVALAAERDGLVPDCSVDRPLADLVLRNLARRPGASARDVATELGVALRTVQACLRDLMEEGACEAQKSGRTVAYRVEDTTFSEPSRVIFSR